MANPIWEANEKRIMGEHYRRSRLVFKFMQHGVSESRAWDIVDWFAAERATDSGNIRAAERYLAEAYPTAKTMALRIHWALKDDLGLSPDMGEWILRKRGEWEEGRRNF